uniref:Uncharacterized protein n=1 Tax=Acrobeloides nanus TaxID=290746 RepID=A0A914D5Q3_9BILA
TTKFSTVWAQDDVHKRLFHQVASNGIVLYQHFVFPTCAIYATNKDCNVNYNINYTSYLQQFGLDSLTKLRIEQIRISNSDPNQKTYANITLYRGEPSDSTLYSFNGGVLANPKLAMAYTDVSTGTLYSWQLYFPRNKLNQTSLYWVEYWYPQMVPSISDSAIFFDFPSYCSNFTGCVNK